jgi:hypothetical protein
MDLQEVRWDVVWVDLARDRDRWSAVMSAVMNLLVSQNAGNFLAS